MKLDSDEWRIVDLSSEDIYPICQVANYVAGPEAGERLGQIKELIRRLIHQGLLELYMSSVTGAVTGDGTELVPHQRIDECLAWPTAWSAELHSDPVLWVCTSDAGDEQLAAAGD